MAGYCTSADVTAFLPSGGLPNPARVATGDAAGDYLECEGHGLATDTPVTLRAEAGGALPSPLAEGTTYYAIAVSSARFRLASSAGGAAINLTTDGDNFVFAAPLPVDEWIAWGARQVDSFLPPHVTPLVEPYPEIVVTACAELAAMRGLQATGGAQVDLGARLDFVGQRVARWAKGVPVRGTTVQRTQPSYLAIAASAGATDPRGWAGTDPTRLP